MNHIILIDKKENMTSYDVVKKIKRLYHTNKVGHCGTLDPFASGLLIIGVNQATKIMSFLEHDSKEYIATITFGKTTDTFDTEGKVVKESEIITYNDEKIKEVLNTFMGKITQTPPIYSSIHIDGKHLYEYARNNEQVEIPTREVEIFDLKLLENNKDSITIKVNCSRGTYIRSLGVDIAKALNNDGYLTYLRRTKIGNLSVDNANDVDDLLEDKIKVISIKEALDFKKINLLSEKKKIRAYNGQPLTFELNDDKILLLDDSNEIAIYEKYENNDYHCVRGLFDEDIRLRRIKELSK